MKIAIVCGHYIPSLGYLEVHLARALARGGHEVTVITSDSIPGYVRKKTFEIQFDTNEIDQGVAVLRLKPFFAFGQIVWPKGVRRAVDQVKPELVIVIGLGKRFPMPVLKKGDFKLGVLLGDNAHSYSNRGLLQKIVQLIIKRPVYQKALSAADWLFHYTPETPEVLSEWLGQSAQRIIDLKSKYISLGFDERTFNYSDGLRDQARAALNLKKDEIVLISVARLGKNKRFEEWIQASEKLMAEGYSLKVIFIGASKDEYGLALRNRVQKSNFAEQFLIRDFLPHSEINWYYHAADIGYWPITAISVFEGMGTGLYLLVPPAKSLTHIAVHEHFGAFLTTNLQEDIQKAVADFRKVDRNTRAELARNHFCYTSISDALLSSFETA